MPVVLLKKRLDVTIKAFLWCQYLCFLLEDNHASGCSEVGCLERVEVDTA